MFQRMMPTVATLALVAVMAGCTASATGTVQPAGGGGGGGEVAKSSPDPTVSPIPSPFASPQGTGDQTTGDKGTGSKGGTDIPSVPQTQP